MSSRVHILFDERGEVVEYELRPRLDPYRIERAWRLACTPEVAVALLAGESVPLDRLDQTWVERYGLREAA